LLFLILGDLGPAIVICFTFIILFSFCRGDFLYMAGYVILFVLVTWFFNHIWLSVLITFGTFAVIAFLKPRLISESAFMALVVITAFLTIDKIPGLDKIIPGPVGRLIDRKAIWQDPWNNEVYGGDQVANGLWAMASGGLSGAGVGQGFAKTIPEAHTDMILPAIGEEFGWAGMAAVFILFFIIPAPGHHYRQANRNPTAFLSQLRYRHLYFCAVFAYRRRLDWRIALVGGVAAFRKLWRFLAGY